MPVLKSERGMTAVELVIVVVILGLIGVPLAMSLTSALRTVPEANKRSASAANRFFLSDTWARDSLNASTMTTPDASKKNVWQAGSCPSDKTNLAAETQTILDVGWNDGGTATRVTYKAYYTLVAGTAGASTSILRVDIKRNDGADRIVATGYCDKSGFGTTPVWKVIREDIKDDLHIKFRLQLNLRASPSDVVDSVDFEGATGTTRTGLLDGT
jgi:type II secretory pathway pseudopilin PulG